MASKTFIKTLFKSESVDMYSQMDTYAQATCENIVVNIFRLNTTAGEHLYVQFFDKTMARDNWAILSGLHPLSAAMVSVLKSNSPYPNSPDENVDAIAGLLAHDDFRSEIRTQPGSPEKVLDLIDRLIAEDLRKAIDDEMPRGRDPDPMGKAI